MAVALSETGPFSYDKYTLTSTQAENDPAKRTFTLTNAVFNPALPETLEVLIGGVKLKGDGTATSAGSGDEFYVNSATSPTTMTIETNTVLNSTSDSSVTSLGTGDLLVIRRISNRTTKNVDYAPGSVIREVDLDNSNTQVIHVAQEAMDIASASMILGADDKFDGKSKVIKDVADPTNDQDVATKVYADANVATTLSYKNTTNDYKLESKDWAQKIDGQVKVYTDGSVSGSFIEDSAKNWASGTTSAAPAGGSAKEWAIGGEETISNKPDGSEYSAKEYAQGVTAAGGTAKQWALGGGSHVEATEVITGKYSARKYASNASAFADAASASEIAARNTANAVTNIFDDFGDKYLGAMNEDDTATTASITGAKWVKGGSQITNVTQASGTIEIGQVLTNDGSATGWPTTETVRIIDYNSGTSIITINQVFTDAQTSGETLTGNGYGIYGAYDDAKEGPAKDNDNGNLVDGALYFDTTNSVNSMRVYDLGNTKWVKATSSGTISISEFKFTTTANQTTFSGTATTGGTLAYTTSNLIVTLNGVVLENGTDYTADNGTSVVLDSGAAVGHELNVIAFKSFETADMVSATNGGTFNGNVSFGDNNITNVGDIAVDTISSDAGTSIGVTLGTDSGDDFNVGSGKLVVEGDTGNVGINNAAPSQVLDIVGTGLELGSSRSAGTTKSARITAPLHTMTGTYDNMPIISGYNSGSTAAQIYIGGGWAGVGCASAISFYTGTDPKEGTGTTRMTINSSGNVTIGAGGDLETSTTGKIKQKGAFMQSSTHQALTLGY